MRLISAFCLVVTLLLIYISPVSACSGGSPFLIDYLEEYDLIVEANVLEVDDRGYSAVLQTSQYFKGQAGEYLAVMRFPPALETVATIRDYDTGCLYTGYGQKWINGSSGYFALKSNGDGTYSDAVFGTVAHFIPTGDEVEFYSFDVRTDTEWQSESLPVNEFEDLLLSYGEMALAQQPTANSYPLMRFLNVTTVSGQRYRLNPDRSVTVLDPETAPIAVSNDGSHVAFQIDDEQVGFQYLSLTRKPLFEDITNDGGWLIPQPGRFLMFSPDSNFVAVQTESEITLYLFHNYERGGYGQRMTMQIVATTNIQSSAESNSIPVVWSADSTTISYQDQSGIWLWDLFESNEAMLVVPDVPDTFQLLGISQTGRYIRFGQADAWELLDTSTGASYPNALATPDERNLIYIEQEFPEDMPDVDRLGNQQCQAPLARNCPIYISFPLNADGTAPDIFWYKHNQIALLGCNEDTCYVSSYPWQLAIGNTYNQESQLNMPLLLFDAFDYDLTYDQPVVAVDGTILEFGFYPSYARDEPSDPIPEIDSIDLSNVLDAPIVDLEWGLPIFYRHNHS